MSPRDVWKYLCCDCGERRDEYTCLDDGTPICIECGSDYLKHELVVAYVTYDSIADLEAREAARELRRLSDQPLPIPNLRVRQAGG
jgi:hypothetical protein